ncbi:Pkinase-fungal domain-containing protein [Mycena chlorophos]|uniref:Pkinase-fungal domain-containing protein n=1 Tax=Mycena chlorophos TaxID=658473 RepID=A0A8H6WPP9_MYCCL|nr:Pkinase-fungal domain-containing protein [Mycena chlorophos]
MKAGFLFNNGSPLLSRPLYANNAPLSELVREFAAIVARPEPALTHDAVLECLRLSLAHDEWPVDDEWSVFEPENTTKNNAEMEGRTPTLVPVLNGSNETWAAGEKLDSRDVMEVAAAFRDNKRKRDGTDEASRGRR